MLIHDSKHREMVFRISTSDIFHDEFSFFFGGYYMVFLVTDNALYSRIFTWFLGVSVTKLLRPLGICFLIACRSK